MSDPIEIHTAAMKALQIQPVLSSSGSFPSLAVPKLLPLSDSEDDRNSKESDVQPIPDEILQETATYSGFLKKMGGLRKSWKLRYLVLRPTRLSWYKNELEYELLNIVPLAEILNVSQVEDKKFTFGIVTKNRTFYLRAETESNMLEWITQLKSAIVLTGGALSGSPLPLQILPTAATKTDIPSPTYSQGSSARSSSVVGPGTPKEFQVDPQTLQLTQEQMRDTVLHQGYINRIKSGITTKSKKYWCVLRRECLTFYRDEKEYEVRYLMMLKDILSIHPIDLNIKRPSEYLFKIVYQKKSWTLASDGQEEMLKWVVDLTGAHKSCVDSLLVL